MYKINFARLHYSYVIVVLALHKVLKIVNNEQPKALIETNMFIITRDAAKELKINHSTIWTGKIDLVPHEQSKLENIFYKLSF